MKFTKYYFILPICEFSNISHLKVNGTTSKA